MKKSATFSPCGLYRWSLTRTWDKDSGTVAFVGLNPSTADESEDDPTIRRCINYAKSWGYGRLVMLNLFAFRATDPRVMMQAADPVGDMNNNVLIEYSHSSALVIAAWGNHGTYKNRARDVVSLLPRLKALKINKATGQPAHPLYLKADLKPFTYVYPVVM